MLVVAVQVPTLEAELKASGDAARASTAQVVNATDLMLTTKSLSPLVPGDRAEDTREIFRPAYETLK
jgi:hypothetical protein